LKALDVEYCIPMIVVLHCGVRCELMSLKMRCMLWEQRLSNSCWNGWPIFSFCAFNILPAGILVAVSVKILISYV